MHDVIRCTRRSGLPAVLAMLDACPDDRILVVGDPELADEHQRHCRATHVVHATKAQPSWTGAIADYPKPPW